VVGALALGRKQMKPQAADVPLVGLENSVRRVELGLRLKRSSDQQLFLNSFK